MNEELIEELRASGEEVEVRYVATPDTIVEGDGEVRRIAGYAAVFNSASEEMTFKDGRRFKEIVRPGAFADSLVAKRDVLARFEHSQILGRTSNGTLRLTEDHRGLKYEIDPPNTTAGRDAVELIRRRDVPYSSFAFTVRKGGDTWKRENGQLVRELRSIVLIDVSPVAKPAYAATDVALRSLELNVTNGSLSELQDSEQKPVATPNLVASRLALAERL